MKKLIGSLFVVMFAVGVSQAVFHYTETLPPGSPAGGMPVSNGYDWNVTSSTGTVSPSFNTAFTPFVQTIAQISALTPSTTGQVIVISNPATFNAGTYGLCISSGILTGAWVQVSSATAISACK